MHLSAPVLSLLLNATAWAIAAGCAAITLWLWHGMRRLLATTREISSADDLLLFRTFVSKQMFGTLAFMLLAMLLMFVFFGGSALGVDVAWMPFVLQVGPWLVLGNKIRESERQCRSLPTAPEIEAAYSETVRMWMQRALPRFAPIAIETTERPLLDCSQHGRTNAAPCTRCGTFRCVTCTQAAGPMSKLCDVCREQGQTRIDDLMPALRATTRASAVASTLGVVDMTVGSLMFSDPAVGSTMLPQVLVVVGAITFVAGSLWGMFFRIGRRLSIVCALVHLLVVPIGTVFAIWVVWTGLRAWEGTSAEGREAAIASSISKLSSRTLAIGISMVVVLVYGAATIAFVNGVAMAWVER